MSRFRFRRDVFAQTIGEPVDHTHRSPQFGLAGIIRYFGVRSGVAEIECPGCEEVGRREKLFVSRIAWRDERAKPLQIVGLGEWHIRQHKQALEKLWL